MKRSLTYKQSGVSIDEGEKLVRFIKPLAKATYTKGVVAGVGGFGAPFSLKFKKLKKNKTFRNVKNTMIVSKKTQKNKKIQKCQKN